MSTNGPDTTSHSNGIPHSVTTDVGYTVGHTWVIVVGAVALIWAMGFAFKSVRLG